MGRRTRNWQSSSRSFPKGDRARPADAWAADTLTACASGTAIPTWVERARWPSHGRTPIALTVEQRLQITRAAERLTQEFSGVLNADTIERFVNDSLDQLIEKARLP